MTTHTLSVLVENKPGVLAHVAGLFSRRAFNISSLAVGPTAEAGVSRMTIVLGPEFSADEQRAATRRVVARAETAHADMETR